MEIARMVVKFNNEYEIEFGTCNSIVFPRSKLPFQSDWNQTNTE